MAWMQQEYMMGVGGNTHLVRSNGLDAAIMYFWDTWCRTEVDVRRLVRAILFTLRTSDPFHTLLDRSLARFAQEILLTLCTGDHLHTSHE